MARPLRFRRFNILVESSEISCRYLTRFVRAVGGLVLAVGGLAFIARMLYGLF